MATSEFIAIIITGIVLGMRFIHAREVIHRPLKPSNVLLDEQGCPQISDLGLSKFAETDMSMTRGLGTLLYMAPEMFEGVEYSKPVDVYSFAILFYDVVFGDPPFPAY
jgi:serine/threonine protein kinase